MESSTGSVRSIGSWLVGVGLLAILSVAATSVVSLPLAQAQSGASVELRILVISTGSAADDPGLDLLDDVLDEIGVPYDVVDSSVDELTRDMLATGQRGFYNGIIITTAGLDPGDGGSGFTDAEWEILQTYERDFDVREAIVSGEPVVSSPLVDFGLVQSGSGTDMVGRWVGPAGSQLFTYVNTEADLALADFALTGSLRNDGVGPTVTPVLVNAADANQILISRLSYDDGREVLLSTISNAWFLIHSQVLVYGLIEFATKGLHLGAQRVFLNAHVDDFLLATAIWDSETKSNSVHETYRNQPEDIDTVLAGQQALVDGYRTIDEFNVEFAFNSFGSGLVPPFGLALISDTTVAQELPGRRYGNSGVLRMSATRSVLVEFDLGSDLDESDTVFGLRLLGAAAGAASNGEVCRITQAWDEAQVTWLDAAVGQPWAGSSGPAVDRATCLSFALGDGNDVVDVSDLVSDWRSGEPNYGFALTVEGSYSTVAREAGVGVALARGVVQTQLDPLTERLLEAGDSVRLLNHTFSHLDMDSSNGTTEVEAYREIVANLLWWEALGLPGIEQNRQTVITGEHSGLADNNGTVLDLTDDIDFPEGVNPALLDAVEASGVRYVAADASRPGQAQETFIGDRDIVILPRYPTGVFFNVRTPDELTDEYNWIFNGSYLARGEDPCDVAAAICEVVNYEQIVEAETEIGLRQMLTYRAWPHFFHNPNLSNYDGQGSTVLFDWLEGVMDRYEEVFVLPVLSPSFEEIGDRAAARLRARSVDLEAILDLDSGVLTIQADEDVAIEITGVASGAPYGPRLIAQVELKAASSQALAVAPGTVSAVVGEAATSIGGSLPRLGLTARTRLTVGGGYESLLRFDTSEVVSVPEFALLRLPAVRVSGAAPEAIAEVCLVTEAWVAAEATRVEASSGVPWSTNGGAAVDSESCVSTSLADGRVTVVDIAGFVGAWAAGTANNGIVLRTDGQTMADFDSFGAVRGGPTLALG